MTIFSVASFVITLRETMEAALIVGILLAYLSKTNNDKLKKDVWIGTALAIAASVVGAVIFHIVLGGFEGNTEKLFEGIVMTTAAVVLTWMIVWMFSNSHTLKFELEQKTDVVLSNESRYALVVLAFISVFREGIETVLFLSSVGAKEGVVAETFGAVVGIFLATVLAVLFFRGTVDLNIKQFFKITSVILIFFAAGLFSHAIHEFQELGYFGTENNFWNKVRWDTQSILNDKDDGLGSLMRALFGYQDTPSILELVAYGFYWIMIGLMFVKVNKNNLETTEPSTA
ncbi:MAG: FTR1 family iron permease [Candidatus Kariarchaeaceae archaeon]|jgi:high-affinity iron transporter